MGRKFKVFFTSKLTLVFPRGVLGFPRWCSGKESAFEPWGSFLSQEASLEKEMATHSNILA